MMARGFVTFEGIKQLIDPLLSRRRQCTCVGSGYDVAAGCDLVATSTTVFRNSLCLHVYSRRQDDDRRKWCCDERS